MRTAVYLFSVAALSLLAFGSDAAWGQIVNGSFEDDGRIDSIARTDPNGWNAAVPGEANQFTGYVGTDWATEGMYNLTICSGYAFFDPCDMAIVSQPVVLTDVNEIFFDVRLQSQ